MKLAGVKHRAGTDIGPCFMCGEKAQYAFFYDEAVGYFVVGGEPRVCAPCNEKNAALSIEDRRVAFAAFQTTPDAPSGRDQIGDVLSRSEEFKARGRV